MFRSSSSTVRPPPASPPRRARALLAIALALPLALTACGGGGGGDDDDDDDGGGGGGGVPATASVARGAQLYDTWWKVTGANPPSGTHLAYPLVGTQTGAITWRCAECHGWDYKGVTGVNATGAHYTGIGGVLAAAGDSAAALYAAIDGAAGAHDFAAVLATDDLWDAVAFVKSGALDPSPWINASTGAALGDATAGATLYASRCASCHGANGASLDLGAGQDVGDRADADPWQVLHRIRWGVPGTAMPSMETAGLSHSQQASILAYAQTLGGTPPPPPPAAVSYATDVAPIWTSRGCTGCHGGSGGLSLSGSATASRSALLAGRVNTTTPAASLILTKPLTGSGVSHGGGKTFSSTADADYQKILDWITQGALAN